VSEIEKMRDGNSVVLGSRAVYGVKVEGRVCMSDDIFGHSCKF